MDILREYVKNHTKKSLKYYYVITEIGKPVISRCNQLLQKCIYRNLISQFVKIGQF